EAMRLFPPVHYQERKAIIADEIQGFPVSAQAHVILSQWLTHRHPEFWDEPDKFKPERFLPARATTRPRFAYFPFGGGARFCIGKPFVMMEGPLVLATIIQRL